LLFFNPFNNLYKKCNLKESEPNIAEHPIYEEIIRNYEEKREQRGQPETSLSETPSTNPPSNQGILVAPISGLTKSVVDITNQDPSLVSPVQPSISSIQTIDPLTKPPGGGSRKTNKLSRKNKYTKKHRTIKKHFESKHKFTIKK
jgi:hypothetical protein